jgi:hypothetical protein
LDLSKTAHIFYISVLAAIVIVVLAALSYYGFGYYQTILGERFFHENHSTLKPSGPIGHGLGIFGSLFMIIGVFSYMARKRYRFLSRFGLLKHWLEFHIFLCTLGPILVLFHTSFKFGGIVAISFWSMVAVFLSGIIGRFIYIQIPRTIEGRELSLNEVKGMKSDVGAFIKGTLNLDDEIYKPIAEATRIGTGDEQSGKKRKSLRQIRALLKKHNVDQESAKKILKLVKNEISLNRRISRLNTMQNLFKYWHVAHLPFALVMLVIMVIHVMVTIVFGYRWIF